MSKKYLAILFFTNMILGTGGRADDPAPIPLPVDTQNRCPYPSGNWKQGENACVDNSLSSYNSPQHGEECILDTYCPYITWYGSHSKWPNRYRWNKGQPTPSLNVKDAEISCVSNCSSLNESTQQFKPWNLKKPSE